MLTLPQSTDVNKRIPKQKFYENLAVTHALKRVFIDQIKVDILAQQDCSHNHEPSRWGNRNRD